MIVFDTKQRTDGYDAAKRQKFIIHSQGEDTAPKMTMSERSVAVEDINQKVEDGIKSFEGFQKKLQCIIHALNAQHSSMTELNRNRLKVRCSRDDQYIIVHGV